MSSLPLVFTNDGGFSSQPQAASAFDADPNDHEYFASSVEEIDVGRDYVTSLAAEPPHVFDIVWNMDLNAALDLAGIRVPYVTDVNEQEHKAGGTVGTLVYELATDNFGPIEIECKRSIDTTNPLDPITTIEYTDPGGEIRSGSGSDEKNAMTELAKQLMVDVSRNIVLLAADKSQDVGSTMAVVMVARISSGVEKSFMQGAQNNSVITFEQSLKKSTGSFNWYSTNGDNSRSVTVQVKSGLAQLFDRKPELNKLLGSAASASTFLDSKLIADKMQNDGPPADDFYLKLFSRAQIMEVLEAVADKGSRVNTGDDYTDRRYNFQTGDSITAVVKVKDSDAGNTNSDRWLITLQQT